MAQGSLLFDGEPEREPAAVVVPVDVPQPQSIDDLSFLPFTPRDYQAEASLNSFRLYDAGERGIIVRLFTGAGKTPVASMTAMLWLKRDPNNRVLVLCHERQLVGQFAEEIEQFTGIRPGIEMADQAVSAKWVPLITVASRATLMERTVGTRSPAVPEGCDVIPQGDVFDDIPSDPSPADEPQTVSRLYKFDSLAHNWLVLIDEGHRYAYKLKSVRHIIDWFEKNPNNWRVLQTATPERGDKVSLSRLAPAIAIDMPLYDLNGGKCGVHEGWAVPYDQRFVTVHGVDFKTLREVSGDFDEGQLEEMLTERKALLSMIRPTLDLVGDRRTIIFSATVGMAKMVAHTINEFARYKCSGCEAIQWEHSDDMKHAAVPCKRCGGELVEVAAGELARSLDGSYADHLRQEVYKQHQGGSFQYLSVCGLCREGYNDCLGEDTEILTERGWKLWFEVHEGDLMYSMNTDTEKMELVSVDAFTRRPLAPGERMVSMQGQHINLRITEGHDLYVKRYNARKTPKIIGKYEPLKARDMVGRKIDTVIPLAAEYEEFSGVPLTDDEIKFVAWFMTDGGFTKKTEVTISQSMVNEKKMFRIMGILARCGFDYRFRIRKPSNLAYSQNEMTEFRVPLGNHSGRMKRNGWGRLAKYLSKKVSKLLHQMTREQFKLFWDEMLLGDGSVMEGRAGWLLCAIKEQADAYTMMAVTRGFATSYAEVITPAGRTVYRVSIRDRREITTRPSDPRSTRITFEDPRPTEHVWCVTNRNGTIVTRRGGKVCIIGNCQLAAVAIFRPTRSRSLAEQMKGRVCRPLKGIVNGLNTKEERKAAIAASEKPFAMVIDLVGVTGLADCASTAHIMAEGKPDEVIDLANKKAMEATGPCDMGKMIEEAEAEIEAKKAEAERLRLLEEGRAKKRAEARKHQEEEKERQRKEMQEKQRVEREAANRMRKLRGDVDYSERQVSAGGGGMVHVKQQGGMRMPFGKHQGKALSELPGGYLRAILEKSKLSPGLTKALRNEMNRRERHREQSLPIQAPTTQPQSASTGDARCTPQQARVLQRFGHSTDVSYAEAGNLIQQINQGLKERKLNFAG
jgi:superfamily II DNA or RNA helicase